MRQIRKWLGVFLLAAIGFGWVAEATGPCADDDCGSCCVMCCQTCSSGVLVPAASTCLCFFMEQHGSAPILSPYSPLFITDIFQPPRLA